MAYIGCDSASPSIGEMLRPFLRQEHPEHMVPSKFIAQTALRKTPDWEIDRRCLPSPPDAPVKLRLSGPPRDSIERLAVWWSQHLGVADVGVHEDFFDLAATLQEVEEAMQTQALRWSSRLSLLSATPP